MTANELMRMTASSGVVIKIGGRYVCGFSKKGRPITSWTLVRAMFFGSWERQKIEKICDRIRARGVLPYIQLVGIV